MSKSIERLVIERALEIIRTRWTWGAWAEDDCVMPVSPYSKQARYFCAEGAIKRATRELLGPGKSRVAARIIRHVDGPGRYDDGQLLRANDSPRGGKRVVVRMMRKRLAQL